MLTEGSSIFLAHASSALREVDNGLRTLRQVAVNWFPGVAIESPGKC